MGWTGRALVLAILALPLGGCWKDQQKALSACIGTHPYHARLPALAHVETRLTRCMDNLGYRIAYDSRSCANAAVPRRNAYCYAPKGWLAGLGFQIEMLFRPRPKPPAALQLHQ
jgi:hypothetical protein